MHQIQFQHVAVGATFKEKGIIGERTYIKVDDNHALLIGHENPRFHTGDGGIGRVDDFYSSELVLLINPSWGIGGCDV